MMVSSNKMLTHPCPKAILNDPGNLYANLDNRTSPRHSAGATAALMADPAYEGFLYHRLITSKNML